MNQIKFHTDQWDVARQNAVLNIMKFYFQVWVNKHIPLTQS